MCEVTDTDIVHQFGALKTNYIDTMEENKVLRETVDLLTKRLKTKEDHRVRLIALAKDNTDKYRKRARCWQERNDQLESIVEEQRTSIHEYSRRIVALESMVAEKSEELESCLSTINRLNKEVASLTNRMDTNSNNNNNNNSVLNVSNQLITTNIPAVALKLNHPFFCEDSKEPRKKRRTPKAESQKKARRWSNLNITISGANASKGIGINSSSSNSENDLSSSRDKRRKLYHIDDDATIDLVNENEKD